MTDFKKDMARIQTLVAMRSLPPAALWRSRTAA